MQVCSVLVGVINLDFYLHLLPIMPCQYYIEATVYIVIWLIRRQYNRRLLFI